MFESINHPVSGEKGYFCTMAHKRVIDAVLEQYKIPARNVGDDLLEQ